MRYDCRSVPYRNGRHDECQDIHQGTGTCRIGGRSQRHRDHLTFIRQARHPHVHQAGTAFTPHCFVPLYISYFKTTHPTYLTLLLHESLLLHIRLDPFSTIKSPLNCSLSQPSFPEPPSSLLSIRSKPYTLLHHRHFSTSTTAASPPPHHLSRQEESQKASIGHLLRSFSSNTDVPPRHETTPCNSDIQPSHIFRFCSRTLLPIFTSPTT